MKPLIPTLALALIAASPARAQRVVGCSYCGHPPSAPWHTSSCRLSSGGRTERPTQRTRTRPATRPGTRRRSTPSPPRVDPALAARRRAERELESALRHAHRLDHPAGRQLRGLSSAALKAFSEPAVVVRLGDWQTAPRLGGAPAPARLPDWPLPALRRQGAPHLKALRADWRQARARLDGVRQRWTAIAAEDLRTRVAELVDAALSRAGFAIRVGAVYRFREELKGYVDPITGALRETLTLIPSILVHGAKTGDEYAVYERYAKLEATMTRKVAGAR